MNGCVFTIVTVTCVKYATWYIVYLCLEENSSCINRDAAFKDSAWLCDGLVVKKWLLGPIKYMTEHAVLQNDNHFIGLKKLVLEPFM